MEPSTFQALGVIVVAIVPGYLAVSTYRRARTWRGPSGDLRTVLESVMISLILQIVLAPLTIGILVPIRDHLDQHPWRVAAWLALVTVAIPAATGWLAGGLGDRFFDPRSDWSDGRVGKWLARLLRPAPAPSVWDWLFTARPPDGLFVVVEYLDGRRAAGTFGVGSFALTSPETHGLYLTEEWSVDANGDLVAPVPGTHGLIIQREADIRLIRILGEVPTDGN